MRWLWHELTRPRGASAHRFYRGGRRSKSGVALLLVLTNLLLMSVLVSEMTYTASVRVKLAVHERDEAKAEQLAYTGAQLYELLLVFMDGAARQLGSLGPMLQTMGVDTNNLWQALPMINTGLLRMVFVSGGNIDREELDEVAAEGLSEEEVAESRAGGDEKARNFLDFDGDFIAEVTDEDSKVNVSSIRGQDLTQLMSNPQAQQLFGLMSGEENDSFFIERNLERWELIGNLADWVDADGDRAWQGGSEDTVYANLDSPYRPRNAPFSSFEEIRLVDGWHDDDVWERFGKHLTVYGTGQINVNSAPPEVIRGLLTVYCMPGGVPNEGILDQIMTGLEERRLLMGPFGRPRDFVSTVEQYGGTCSQQANGGSAGNITQAIKVKSTVFRITSTGVVGDAKVTITSILENRSRRGRNAGGGNRSSIIHFSIE